MTTITVRLNSTLSGFVAAKVSENGSYENVSEYMRDLIRQDMARVNRAVFGQLKTELTQAFSAAESTYMSFTAAEVIARNARQR